MFAGFACQLSHVQGGPSDFGFALLRAFADPLDYVAVTIASAKVHSRIDAGGILRQLRIDQADCFKEIFPIQRRKQTHAGNDVADRHLGRSLPVMLCMHHLLDRETLFSELLVQPFDNRHDGGILFAQALRQLHNKGPADRFPTAHSH